DWSCRRIASARIGSWNSCGMFMSLISHGDELAEELRPGQRRGITCRRDRRPTWAKYGECGRPVTAFRREEGRGGRIPQGVFPRPRCCAPSGRIPSSPPETRLRLQNVLAQGTRSHRCLLAPTLITCARAFRRTFVDNTLESSRPSDPLRALPTSPVH